MKIGSPFPSSRAAWCVPYALDPKNHGPPLSPPWVLTYCMRIHVPLQKEPAPSRSYSLFLVLDRSAAVATGPTGFTHCVTDGHLGPVNPASDFSWIGADAVVNDVGVSQPRGDVPLNVLTAAICGGYENEVGAVFLKNLRVVAMGCRAHALAVVAGSPHAEACGAFNHEKASVRVLWDGCLPDLHNHAACHNWRCRRSHSPLQRVDVFRCGGGCENLARPKVKIESRCLPVREFSDAVPRSFQHVERKRRLADGNE